MPRHTLSILTPKMPFGMAKVYIFGNRLQDISLSHPGAVPDRVESQVRDSQVGIYVGVGVRLTFGGCVPPHYAEDPRARVASALSGASSTRKALDRLGIGISTAIRRVQRLQTEGYVGSVERLGQPSVGAIPEYRWTLYQKLISGLGLQFLDNPNTTD